LVEGDRVGDVAEAQDALRERALHDEDETLSGLLELTGIRAGAGLEELVLHDERPELARVQVPDLVVRRVESDERRRGRGLLRQRELQILHRARYGLFQRDLFVRAGRRDEQANTQLVGPSEGRYDDLRWEVS